MEERPTRLRDYARGHEGVLPNPTRQLGNVPKIRGRSAKGGSRLAAPDVPTLAVNYEAEPPAFCFLYTQPGFRIGDLVDDKDKVAVLDIIETLSQKTWGWITRSGKQHGSEKIPLHQLHENVPTCVGATDDVLSFRVKSRATYRLLGFRNGRILHVLWIDRDGRVYDHGA